MLKNNENGDTPLHETADYAHETAEVLPSDRAKDKRFSRVMWILLGVFVIVSMVIGISDYVEKQRQAKEERDKFVAKVGREPSLQGVNSKGETDLHIAVRLNLPALTRSLLSQGANIHAKTNKIGNTPLHYAAIFKAHETAEVLLKHRADVNAKSKYGNTPLHYAENLKADETIQVLRNYGAVNK